MDVQDFLVSERRKYLKIAGDLADKADAEGRGLTPDEVKSAEAAVQMAADLSQRAEDEKDKQHLRDLMGELDEANTKGTLMPVREPALASRARKTVGEQIVFSDQFQALMGRARAGGMKSAHMPALDIPTDLWRHKAVGDPGVPILEADTDSLWGDQSTTAGALTTLGGLEDPGFRAARLTIADLIPVIPVTVGNTATYPVVKARDVSELSTAQTEGQTKAGVGYEFDIAVEILETYAGYVKFSTQWMEDAPGLVAYINADLPLQVRTVEEGVLSDKLYSLADGASSGSNINGTTSFDAIAEAIAVMQSAGFEPDALVVTPLDAARLRTEKLPMAGSYIGGPPGTNPWGIRVVVSSHAVEYSPLIGAFRQGAKLYRKGGMTVQLATQNDTDFIENLVTLRAEERFVLGVTYPEAFSVVSLTS